MMVFCALRDCLLTTFALHSYSFDTKDTVPPAHPQGIILYPRKENKHFFFILSSLIIIFS